MVERVNILAFIYTKSPEPHFLLLKRVHTKGGFWQPVSGGINQHEQPVHAVKREVLEETGISDLIKIIDLEFSYQFEATKNNTKMNMKDICFGVEVSRIQSVTLSSEHSVYKWCKIEEVNRLLDWKYSQLAFEKLLCFL